MRFLPLLCYTALDLGTDLSLNSILLADCVAKY